MSDPLVIGVLLASSFVLWINALVLHHRGRELTLGLAQEMAQHLGSMQKVIEDIAQIPEVLQDLNLGGVQLMPQKTLGETILDGAIKYFWGNSDQSKTIESEQLVEVDATKTESDLHP